MTESKDEQTPEQNLQAHLESNPRIKKVYFNAAGSWLFHEHPLFPITRSAEEVKSDGIKISEEEKSISVKTAEPEITGKDTPVINDPNEIVLPPPGTTDNAIPPQKSKKV